MSVWDRLVGQDEVVAELRAAAAQGARARATRGTPGGARLSHAWLLTGPPGSGRSVAARAFAAALQCDRQGCGVCSQCRPVLSGGHADLLTLVPEGREIVVASVRDLVRDAARAPLGGRWLVVLVEDADRMNERAGNALLKALEEPPPATVFLLCAPGADDVLPTVRSRCRTVRLRTPSPADVARALEADGVAPAEAAWAARAAQGHVGRARRLARDDEARARRSDALSLVTDLITVPTALEAAGALVAAAEAEAEAVAGAAAERETSDLRLALGEGAQRGEKERRLTGVGKDLKDLADSQKKRAARVRTDALDRALSDVAAFYRDVLVRQTGADVAPVHADLARDARSVATATDAATTTRRLQAVLRARRLLVETQANPRLVVESLALELLHAGRAAPPPAPVG